MHKPPSRGSRAVAGAAGDVQRVLLGPRNDAKPACARKHTHARERGASGRNGGGGVPSSRGKLAAAEGSNGGARVGRAGAREGRGYGAPFSTPKLDHRNSTVPAKSKGERGERWGKQRATRARAVDVRGQARGAMRVARGAGAAHLTRGPRR